MGNENDGDGASGETVGDRLEALREALGERERRAFAAGFGLDPGDYTKITQDQRGLSIKRAAALCKRYGVTLEFIYNGNIVGLPAELRDQVRSILARRNGDRA